MIMQYGAKGSRTSLGSRLGFCCCIVNQWMRVQGILGEGIDSIAQKKAPRILN